MTHDAFTRIAATIAGSPLTLIVAFAVMAAVGAVAIRRAIHARRIARDAEDLAAWLNRIPRRSAPVGLPLHEIRDKSLTFMSETLVPLRHKLQRDEVIAPLAGIFFSMLGWTLALPGALETLRIDPDRLTTTLAMGAATSCLGFLFTAVSVFAGKRLDVAEGRLVAGLDRLGPDQTSRPPEREDRVA